MNCEHIKSNKMIEIMEMYGVKNVKHVNGNTYKFNHREIKRYYCVTRVSNGRNQRIG